MKKRDKKIQDQLEKRKTKRALYEKARKQKYKSVKTHKIAAVQKRDQNGP